MAMSPMATERNPFMSSSGDDAAYKDLTGVEVELPLEDDDGLYEDTMEEVPYDHYENVALKLTDKERSEIASQVVEDFESDKASRAEWEAMFEKGFDLLGLKLEDATEPFEGACTAVHPLIIESSVKFQAKAIQEIFPAKGPVKTQIIGVSTPEKEEQANRVMNFMNYQTTTQMVEYFDELERMLFHLPIFGSAIKKLYYDPNLERPVSEFVPIDQFVVSNNSPDLRRASRYTQIIYRTPNDLKRDVLTGFYDLPEDGDDLPAPGKIQPTSLRQKMDEVTGMSSVSENEEGYTLLEHHCYLELDVDTAEGEEEYLGNMTVALPYIVTIDMDSLTVLSIRRNWKEGDTRTEKLSWFTHYKFVPGFGFYGLGYIHLLGNLTATATASMRSLIDAGQFANLPGGFKARGVRITGDNSPISPGEFREVEATGIDLTKAIIPLPFKEPSQVLMGMLEFVAKTGQKFADTSDQVISDSTNYGPVGTTLALLEASTKFFSAIHKRIHHAQRNELQILARINYDYLPETYPYDVPTADGKVFKSDFDGRVDVIPVSDPNVPSSAHRIAMAQTVLQLSSQAPQGTYNVKSVHKYILGAMNIDSPERFIAPDMQPQPLDPVTDIHQASIGMPIKAFPGQDHKSHIVIKTAFIQDPTLGMNPIMAQVVPVLEANIREHMITQYEEQMGGMLQAGVEQAGSGSPEAIAAISQGAAQEILMNNQRAAQDTTVEDIERMTLELQRQRLELDREKLKMDSLQSVAKIAIDEDKVDIQRDALEIDSLTKLAELKTGNSNQKESRDDKFLLEVFKTLMKETGTTVDALKKKVDLTPKFQEGGEVKDGGFGSGIADYLDRLFGLRKYAGTKNFGTTVTNPNTRSDVIETSGAGYTDPIQPLITTRPIPPPPSITSVPLPDVVQDARVGSYANKPVAPGLPSGYGTKQDPAYPAGSEEKQIQSADDLERYNILKRQKEERNKPTTPLTDVVNYSIAPGLPSGFTKEEDEIIQSEEDFERDNILKGFEEERNKPITTTTPPPRTVNESLFRTPSQFNKEEKQANKVQVTELVDSKFNKYTPAARAAILASIHWESGGTFSSQVKQRGGPAKGMLQFEGKMRAGYERYLANNKLQDTNEANLDFVYNILNSDDNYNIGSGNRKLINRALNSPDPQKALGTFTDLFLRPGKPHSRERKELLNEYWKGTK